MNRSECNTKAKVAAKASSRREARARRKMRNWPASLKVNAGTPRRRDKKAECRKMKADLAAGKCDKHGKPTGGVHSLTAVFATFLRNTDAEHVARSLQEK